MREDDNHGEEGDSSLATTLTRLFDFDKGGEVYS